MAKAITEVAIGAAAIGAAVLIPGGFMIGTLLVTQTSLITLGASMALTGIMSGIAALQPSQGGIAVGTTTPIGPWGYCYGTQKIGGIEIFRQSNSSQGTSNDKELHRVYVLACHSCVGDQGAFQLRIDGKQVLLEASGPGWTSYSPTQIMQPIVTMTRNADGLVTVQLNAGITGLNGTEIQITECDDNTFNGIWIVTQPDPLDNTTFTFIAGGTPATVTSGQFWTLYADYQDKIYIEFLNGNHTATFTGLLASGTNWSTTDLCLGRTLVYVRMGWSATVFPSSIPNVSFVLNGKNNIFDPRTESYGFTNNAALCIADFLSMPATQGGFGLSIGTDIPTAQLIAAANICDEAVSLAAGGTTPRYTCDTFFMLNQARGKILQDMLSSCAGRISYQGGQFSIFPGAYLSPTLTLTDADVVGSFKFKPRLSIRDTCNGVKGTYISPENAYQQADFPPYMEDADHGYESDPWLAEDNGERIFKEANFPCTVVPATAQRLAKIELLRARFQIRGTVRFSMKAYQAVALDVIQLTHPRYTWENMPFEVLSSRFVWDKSGEVPVIAVELDLAQTNPSIYDWSVAEELTPQGYAQPSNVGNSVCNAPNGLVLYSGPGTTVDGIVYPNTINTGGGGIVTNSLYVSWTPPNDANVLQGGYIEIQWQQAGASGWTAWGRVDPSASSIFITGVNDGGSYNVQIRAVNNAGVPSPWVLAGPETISETLSVFSYTGVPVAPSGTLTAQGLIDGTAQITVANFTPSVYPAPCTPSPSIVGSLVQAQLYYVYYVDPSLAGGAITPIATTNPGTFLGVAGYFLIGSIVTPTYAPRYSPSTAADLGSQTTVSPPSAMDNDLSTYAYVNGSCWTLVNIVGGSPEYDQFSANGDCIWSGFPNIVTSSTTTLYVTAAVTHVVNAGETIPAESCVISCTLGNLATLAIDTAQATYSITVPSGTNLSTLNVECSVTVTPAGGSTQATGTVFLQIYEIYIQ